MIQKDCKWWDDPDRQDGCTVYKDGSRFWYLNNEIHREDGPARIGRDGTQFWYRCGNLHRDDGPAVIYSNGSEAWYSLGYLHREDGPAIITSDGGLIWYNYGNQVKAKSISIDFNWKEEGF